MKLRLTVLLLALPFFMAANGINAEAQSRGLLGWRCAQGSSAVIASECGVTVGDAGDAEKNAIALQRAIDAAPLVLLPKGKFVYNGKLRLRKGGSIIGVGVEDSILFYTGDDVAMEYKRLTEESTYSNITLTGFTLAGGATAQVGIQFINTYQATISGIRINDEFGKIGRGFKTAGIQIIGEPFVTPTAIKEANSAIIAIDNNYIWQCPGDGIRINGKYGAAVLKIAGNHISGNGLGINVIAPDGSYPINNIHIAYNGIEGNVRGGIWAKTLIASSITHCYFENSDGVSVIPIRIGVGGYVQGVVVSSNQIGGKGALYAFECLGAGEDVIVSSNVFTGVGTALHFESARGVQIILNTWDPRFIVGGLLKFDAACALEVKDKYFPQPVGLPNFCQPLNNL